MKGILKILHTEASEGWGGQEIRILSESRWMRDRGHRVVLAAPGSSHLIRKASGEGFETIAVRFKKSRQIADWVRLVHIIRSLRPDVVAAHSSVDSWVGLLAARFCKVPCAIRYRHFGFPVRNSRVNRWQYSRLCDRVITTADFISKPLERMFRLPPGKVVTITTGVGFCENGLSRETARSRLCAELRLPENSRFIGCISVLRGGKGHLFLMDAFQLIADVYPELHLVIVGDGPQKGAIERKRLELPHNARIHLVGHRDDPLSYFRAFEAAILASVKPEGVPQSILQAMAAECPVVGTTVGGIPEVLTDRQTGLLVPPSDSRRLADAIQTVLDRPDLAALFTSKARAMVEQKYSLDRMGHKVLEVIMDSLGRRE